MTATLVATADERAEAPPALGTGYRAHLDGMRALAVYLVVLFHAAVDRFNGGFIGVDVFFVLSGYLVTQVLMRTLDLGTGRRRIRPGGFGRFYARRYRRLLPASFVALVVTAIVYSAIASQAELQSTIGAFKATFLYVANWYFIHQASDYFAAAVNNNPVQQFWSLAVEEQFYIVWPVVLTLLYLATNTLRRHAHRARQVLVAGAALLSLVWALHLADSNISRAYYGTDARAYQLLAGALLALAPGILGRVRRFRITWFAAPVAVVMLIVLSTSYVDVNPIKRGVGAMVATVLLIVGLETLACGPLNRIFSCGPAVYLGRISYGTYLWHWPVILVTLALTDNHISPLSTFAIAAFVATGLASLSYQVMEMPVRRAPRLDRLAPVVIGAGIAISIVGALVVIPRVLDPYQARAAAAKNTTAPGFTAVPKLDFSLAKQPQSAVVPGVPFLSGWNCYGQPAAACTIVHGHGQKILLIGDSQMWSMFPTFATIAKEHDMTLSTYASAGCPWQRNLYFANQAVADYRARTARCVVVKKDLYERVLPALKPDVVITDSNDYLGENTTHIAVIYDQSGHPIPVASATDLRHQVENETARSLRLLTASAGKVVMIEPVPLATAVEDPLNCLTRSTVVEACRFVTTTKPSTLELMYRKLADNRRVYVENIDQLMCPFLPICDPLVDHQIVRMDQQHMTAAFAVSITNAVDKSLVDAGVLKQ